MKVIKLSNNHNEDVLNVSLNELNEIGVDVIDLSNSNPAPVIGRECELKELFISLSCKKRNSILIKGEPGVGKSSLIHHFSSKYKSYFRIVEISVASIISGCSYRGEFEKRLSEILNFAKKNKVIIFFDEAHLLSMTGGTNTGGLDAMNMLKPFLTSGVSIILATTIDESNHLSEDMAFDRRFRKIIIDKIDRSHFRSIVFSRFDVPATLIERCNELLGSSICINNILDSVDYMISEHNYEKEFGHEKY